MQIVLKKAYWGEGLNQNYISCISVIGFKFDCSNLNYKFAESKFSLRYQQQTSGQLIIRFSGHGKKLKQIYVAFVLKWGNEI